jgi:hypothetical protein
MHAVQQCGRSGDHLPRRIVEQDERAALDERLHERSARVGSGPAASQPRRQVAELTKQPGDLHVAQCDLVEGLEDGRRRRLDDDGNAVAESGGARSDLECGRVRNRRATRHERTSCGRLSNTHEPCRWSTVTSTPYQGVASRSRAQ